MGLGRSRKQDRQAVPAVRQGLLRERRRSSLSYGVTVIDMGVHQLSGLPQKLNLVQVCSLTVLFINMSGGSSIIVRQ